MRLAQDYDDLDDHGRRVVRLVADEEKARCTSKTAALPDLETEKPLDLAYAARRSDRLHTSTGPDTEVEI